MMTAALMFFLRIPPKPRHSIPGHGDKGELNFLLDFENGFVGFEPQDAVRFGVDGVKPP